VTTVTASIVDLVEDCDREKTFVGISTMRANNQWLGRTGNVVVTAITIAVASLLAVPALLLALVPFVG
jgi:hypothetical protein